MWVFTTEKELNERLKPLKLEGKSIGFVPTMGALHIGHGSLLQKAKEQCEIVVCSVFVNPKQFNDQNDFKGYPKTFENDREFLEILGCDFMYFPQVEDVFPHDFQETQVELDGIDEVLEGAFRPGHFKGVVNVVHRLFEIVGPTKAFFGEKDFQQLSIIQKMTEKKNLPLEIVPVETSRTEFGLARSSRNSRLSKQGISKASILYKVLCFARDNYLKEGINFVLSSGKKIIEDEGIKIEYFEAIEKTTLQKLNKANVNTGIVFCIAVYIEEVRLIDNIIINH